MLVAVRWIAFLAPCAVLAATLPASAQPAPGDPVATDAAADDEANRAQAQWLFDSGLDAFDAGRIAEACELFQRSFDARPSPAPLINLGYCRRELGDTEGAVPAFRDYVELLGPDISDAEWAEVETAVRELGGAIERPVRLTVAPPPPPPPPPPPLLAESDGVGQVWFWTTAGAAVALGIGAGVTGGLAYDANQDFLGSGDPDTRDSGQTLQLTTNVLAGIAGAAAVAALVLVFFTDWDGESPPTGSPTVGLGPGGLVLRW